MTFSVLLLLLLHVLLVCIKIRYDNFVLKLCLEIQSSIMEFDMQCMNLQPMFGEPNVDIHP